MGKKPFALALAVLALTLSLHRFPFGQGTTSRITGAVTDNNGGAVLRCYGYANERRHQNFTDHAN